MDKLVAVIKSLCFQEQETNELILFIENLTSLLDIFSSSDESLDIKIKRHHNHLLDEFSRRCVYVLKNHLQKSPFREYREVISYNFKEAVSEKVKTLRFKY